MKDRAKIISNLETKFKLNIVLIQPSKNPDKDYRIVFKPKSKLFVTPLEMEICIVDLETKDITADIKYNL